MSFTPSKPTAGKSPRLPPVTRSVLDDELLKGACVVKDGEVVQRPTTEVMEEPTVHAAAT